MIRTAVACALGIAALATSACPASTDDGQDAGPDAVDDAGQPGQDAGPDDVDAGPLWEGTINRDRSLVWTDAALLDDTATVGLGRVLGAVSDKIGLPPGVLLDRWLRRFATTVHSERAGPARLAQQLATELGADPATWNVDAAPFQVTGVHNRVDLMGVADDGPHCGELRVSVASSDPLIRPFHALFLFRQPAVEGDVDADGHLTCAATALAWAALSDLDNTAFLAAARQMLHEGLVAERFLLFESVELTVSPWEWRQWVPTGNDAIPFDNPPLFQQVDTDALNQAGAERTAFLAFVEDNAAALDARTLLLPASFRPLSRRIAQGVAPVPLDLTGVSTTVLESHPQLRQHLEIVGCGACHTADAEFVQTKEDRTFSPFYTKELVARGTLLVDILHHRPRVIPFGPLQDAPVLPP